MAQKYIIFDSGPLINFSMNGLLDLLERLKRNFKGKFLITKEVKQEIIEHPINIKRYELGALMLKQLLDKGIIELPDLNEKQKFEFDKKTSEIMSMANSMFKVRGKEIHLIDRGEAASLALSYILDDENVIAIDERTTRMICESPENLRKLMQQKLHTKIIPSIKNYDYFKQFKVIRSTELIYIANKKNLIELKDPKAFEAMLYGLKFKGCSVSFEEIDELKRISK